MHLDAPRSREHHRKIRLRHVQRVLDVAIDDQHDLHYGKYSREGEERHDEDGVGAVEVVRASDDASEREQNDGVRREHVTEETLEDKVVEHPPGDDLHREDGQRHGAADLRPGARPVLKTYRTVSITPISPDTFTGS